MTDAVEPTATAEPTPDETAPHLIEEMRGGCTMNPVNPL
jgi:hypothetical protein